MRPAVGSWKIYFKMSIKNAICKISVRESSKVEFKKPSPEKEAVLQSF